MLFLFAEKQPSSSDTSEKKKTIHLVLSILCSASYRLKHTPLDLSLCKPEILDTLVKTCRLTYKRRSVDAAWDSHGAPLVLAHIVSETKNFVPLLKHNFIFQIYEMANPSTEHRNCSLCTDVSRKLESICGIYFDCIFFFIVKVCGQRFDEFAERKGRNWVRSR